MPLSFTISRRRLLILAASYPAISPTWSSPTTPSLSVSELRKVPTSISFSSAVLQLQAEAWRDFMPIVGMPTDPQTSPDGGRPMMVLFQVLHTGPRPSQPLHARTVWLLKGDSIWQSSEIEQSADALDNVKMMVRGGPYWTPRSHFDVVVRFGDDHGKTFDLAARDQLVQVAS
jgi:hypothetical protein